ncbi:PAS domain S-box protein [Rubellimicrobium arenae]|uniref:PAS domain S-box protein n=1 Tax=Rubellimicrobium arenae TaxID=2817372 RepID=UPI001B309A57|nr:sensor histidine kinase [Rubellimicrobium arenae]
MARRVGAVDWGSTPLGPRAAWPPPLTQAVGLMLVMRQPAFVGWGPEVALVYNDDFASLLGPRHPEALGRPLAEVWPALALAGRSALRGAPQALSDQPLGRDWADPVALTGSLSPLRDGTDRVAGLFGVLADSTRQAMALHAPRADQAQSRAEAENLARILEAFEAADYDTDLLTGEIRPSPRLNALYGYPPDHPLSMADCRARYHPDDLESVRSISAEAKPGEPRFQREFRIHLPDGTVRWVLSRGEILFDDAGRPVRARGAAIDITERKRLDAALRDSEARLRRNQEDLRTIADAVPVQIITLDRDQRYRFVNAEVGRSFGLPKEALHGRTLREQVGERTYARLRPWIERALSGQTVRFEDMEPDRHGPGRHGWTEETYIPRLSANGRVEEIVLVDHDITERKETENALRDSEERLASIFASATVGLSEVSLDGRFLQVNEELCRILGRPREQVLELGIADVTHPDDLPPSLEAVARALEESGPAALDKRYLQPDGRITWANSRITRLRHGAGRPDTLLVVTVDLTARRAAESALRRSERRLRTLIDGIPQIVWRAGQGGRWTWSSPQWTAFTGLAVEDSLGPGWLDAIHPDDHGNVLEAWDLAPERSGFDVEHRLRNADGDYRWFATRARPVREEATGAIAEWLGTSTDIDELRRLQEETHVLVMELQHRTRNLIGVVRSLAERTILGSSGLEEFRSRFRDRLAALARVNGLLAQKDVGQRVTFDELIRIELAGLGAVDGEGHGPQVRLTGPTGLRLRSSMVQTLALGLHELATNALKYGALSRPEGHLEVSWSLVSVGGEDRIRVEWIERGVPPTLTGEPRRGYGRELIERALPYQLRAETTYEIGPEGVRCTITLPVSSTMAAGPRVGG